MVKSRTSEEAESFIAVLYNGCIKEDGTIDKDKFQNFIDFLYDGFVEMEFKGCIVSANFAPS